MFLVLEIAALVDLAASHSGLGACLAAFCLLHPCLYHHEGLDFGGWVRHQTEAAHVERAQASGGFREQAHDSTSGEHVAAFPHFLAILVGISMRMCCCLMT